jgi:hypothetical protein
MKSRLVDPIHFFDAKGRSCLSYDQQELRIKELEAEVEKLRRIALRFKYLSDWRPVKSSPIIH